MHPGKAALGGLYFGGLGVTQDYAQAFQWFSRGAEQGDSIGQVSLGWLYQNGLGVTQDYAQAFRWYSLAAEQGNASGQNNLGWMYEKGLGVRTDPALAVQLYRQAAEQGKAAAQHSLGRMYQNGRGVTQDYAQAAQWYRRAAEQGDAAAQKSLQNLTAATQGGGGQQVVSAAPAVASPGTPVSGGICRSVNDFEARFKQVEAQYPRRSHWGSRDNLQWAAFMMQRGIEILQSCGSGLSRADYDANMNAMVNARDSSLRSCEQLSTVSGSCRPVYP